MSGSPGLRLVVSYDAREQGHHGGIYQAGDWIYAGPMDSHGFRIKGRLVHSKSIHSRYGHGSRTLEWMRKHLDPKAEKVVGLIRHKYLMPLDAEMRAKITPLAQPYPKRL